MHLRPRKFPHSVAGYRFRYISSNAALRIGRSVELLTDASKQFLNPLSRQTRRLFDGDLHNAFDGFVELRVQNSSREVLLRTFGLTSYRRVYLFMRWTMIMWWGLRYRSVSLSVHPQNEPMEQFSKDRLVYKIRWKIEGCRRFTGQSKSTILAGHSYYHFDTETGLIKLHVLDRMAPPLNGTSWLWWWLHRIRVYPTLESGSIVSHHDPKQAPRM